MAIGFPVKDDYVTGDVLTAANMNDLSGSVNLLESAQYAAGKNKIINGDFYVNQRNFSSTTSSGTFMFDRWTNYLSNGTVTYSAQTFTPGTAPVAGYEGKNFIRCVTTGQTLTSAAALLIQNIEDVRTLAGQTATISFWAKASTGTPKVAVEISQFFGTGGSPSATVHTPIGAVTLTTSWARYSVSVAVPSISGKTLGTINDSSVPINLWTSAGSDFNTRASSIGIQSATIDIWGVQVEAGSVATAFQTATGTIQGELAACQRYYWRTGGSTSVERISLGIGYSTTRADFTVKLPVTMRVVPASIEYSTLAVDPTGGSFAITNLTIDSFTNSKDSAGLVATVASGLTQYRPYFLEATSTAGYLGLSAEL